MAGLKDFFVSEWLRNRNTMEYHGIWEKIHNPDFNYGEFDMIKTQAGLNSYKISVKKWFARTHATVLKATSTYMVAHMRIRIRR